MLKCYKLCLYGEQNPAVHEGLEITNLWENVRFRVELESFDFLNKQKNRECVETPSQNIGFQCDYIISSRSKLFHIL